MAPNDYLRPQEAALMLGVRAKTVSRWSNEGRLPAIKTVGGHRRFRRQDVERMARELRGAAWARAGERAAPDEGSSSGPLRSYRSPAGGGSLDTDQTPEGTHAGSPPGRRPGG